MARTLFAALLIWLLGPSPIAQSREGADAHPLATADTSSPRATLRSFLDACTDVHRFLREEKSGGTKRNDAFYSGVVNRVYHCLDLSQEAGVLREHTAGESAVTLKEVLDRIPLPPDSEIPGKEELEAAASEGRSINRWRIPNTEILITRMTEGSREGDYLFDADTVARAPEFFRRISDQPYRPKATRGLYHWFLSEPGPRIAPLIFALPDSLRTHFWGRHAVWQWIGLVLGVGISVTIMALTYWLARRRADKLQDSRKIFRYCITLVFPIAAMLVPYLLEGFVRDELRLSGRTLAIVTFTASVIFLFTSMFVIVAAGSRIAAIIITSPKIHPKGLDAQLIRIICRVLSLVAAIIVFLEGGKYLGIPLTTLLASAGVGGLALALAAQDSLKNFFGSMMIILDKPFHIGERIVVKGYDGLVEEIGLRSTKIRLLTGHQVTIPNEEMARSDIENIGRRPHIRRKTNLRLPIHTKPEQAERAVQIVRAIVDDHEGMEPGYPPRVFLNEINDDSLNLCMIYWYHPPDYWKFLAHSQEVNLSIGREFEKAGLEIALPASTLHLAKNDSLPGASRRFDQEGPHPSP